MALVHVEHLRFRQPLDGGERPDRPHAADAGQEFLLDPVLLIAAIQPIGHRAQFVFGFGDVGIQQQQRNSSDLRHPHPGLELAGVGHGEADQHGLPRSVGQQSQRQALRIEWWVVLVLPTVGGQGLAEVSRPVVQPHRDQRKPEVGCRLQVVAGQDAKPARIVRQHLGDAELHGEVGDAGRPGACRVILLHLLIPHGTGQIGVQRSRQVVEPTQERVIAGKLVESLGIHPAKKRDRVLTQLFPQVGIDCGEQLLRRRIPRPSQVDRESFECRETLG